MIKSAELKREVKRGSTFRLTSDLSCIASILFANVNFTHVRTLKLRDTGNQPLGLFSITFMLQIKKRAGVGGGGGSLPIMAYAAMQ